MTISIVLADDHPIVRRGTKTLLEAPADFSVVGEAGDGLEAVRLVERLKPDVLILDLMMPGLSGLEVLRILQQRAPETRVVVLSMHSETSFIAEALKVGATGYVLKGSTEEDLVQAVREAFHGRRFLSSPARELVIDAYIEQSRAAPFNPHESLTPRERAVLQLVAEGKTSTDIAGRLHISVRTVENHRSSVMRKLSLENHSQLVRYAVRQGLISLND